MKAVLSVFNKPKSTKPHLQSIDEEQPPTPPAVSTAEKQDRDFLDAVEDDQDENLPRVLQIMKKHPQNAEMQQKALLKMWDAMHTFHAHPSKDTAMSLGAGDLILSAMRNHRADNVLQSKACICLSALSSQKSTIKRLVELGTPEQAVTALQTHPNSGGSLGWMGLRFLADCMEHGGSAVNASVRGIAGIEEAVREQKRLHTTRADIQGEADRCLRLLNQ